MYPAPVLLLLRCQDDVSTHPSGIQGVGVPSLTRLRLVVIAGRRAALLARRLAVEGHEGRVAAARPAGRPLAALLKVVSALRRGLRLGEVAEGDQGGAAVDGWWVWLVGGVGRGERAAGWLGWVESGVGERASTAGSAHI